MYDFLKILMSSAEQIGNVEYILMTDHDHVWGSKITIKGIVSGNRSFELRLDVQNPEPGAED